MKYICHIMYLDKFIPPYIKFVEKYLNPKQHIFLIYGDEWHLEQFPLPNQDNVIKLWEKFPNVFLRDVYVGYQIHIADKIFLHGLWEHRLNRILCFTFWKLKNCYYAIWGGDLFHYKDGDKNSPWYEKKEKYRRFIIKRFGYMIPVVYGDYHLAVEWYKSNAKMIEPFMYVQFYEHYLDLPLKKQGSIINIQVGNSATRTNNHVAAFEIVCNYALENGLLNNLRIYTPLSYGHDDYAAEVKSKGIEIFRDNFHALESFMPFSEYEKFLQNIDIAIFNQYEQQAMGNIMTLIAMGKKVYINAVATHYQFIVEKGFKIFDLADFNLDPILLEDVEHNRKLMIELYGKDKQIAHQKSLYE